MPFDVTENTSKCIYKIEYFSEFIQAMRLLRNEVFVLISCNLVGGEEEARSNDEWAIVSSVETFCNSYYPSSFESVKLLDPKILVFELIQVDSQTITFYVTSSAIALFVWLESPLSGRFSKNAFLLMPGHSEFIKFKSWTGISEPQYFETNLAIRSLWNTMISL